MFPIRKRLSAAVVALFAVSMVSVTPADARGGKAKTSVNHAGGGHAARAGGGTADRRPARQAPKARPGGSGANRANVANNNRGGGNTVRGGGNTNRGGHNNVVAGNTVVVNRDSDHGYHHGYYDNDWDDDWHHHDGFWDDVGEAVAVTAAVGVTAAVIGEVFDDEPDGCQQSVYYGQTYLYCNGVWYQPTMSGSNTQYVVVNAPQ